MAQLLFFLHGGPGAGSSPRSRRFFDPSFYRIVVVDQRGAGKSTPNASLENNTTWDLVDDIERIRKHLHIEKWHIVFGGSWGSTLALAYSQTYPERVTSLVLRGVFLFDDESMKWLFQRGASEMYPDAWDKYISEIPAGERGDLLGAYYRRLTSEDITIRNKAARAFVEWELTISKLFADEKQIQQLLEDVKFYAPFARFECHYFIFGGWFNSENQLLEGCSKIAHIPCAIVHGRQDIVCRPRAAHELQKRLKNCTLEFIFDAGHSDSEPGIVDALVRATDRFKDLPTHSTSLTKSRTESKTENVQLLRVEQEKQELNKQLAKLESKTHHLTGLVTALAAVSVTLLYFLRMR